MRIMCGMEGVHIQSLRLSKWFGAQGEVVDVHGIMKDKNIRLVIKPGNMTEQIGGKP